MHKGEGGSACFVWKCASRSTLHRVSKKKKKKMNDLSLSRHLNILVCLLANVTIIILSISDRDRRLISQLAENLPIVADDKSIYV